MKSHVSLEQHQCPICAKVHDTGSILLDTRLRDSLERHTVTGVSPCPECAERLKEYVALIEVSGRSIHDRTGNVAWIRREAWSHAFDLEIPPKGIALCNPETLEILKKKVPSNEENRP